ncbi:hypothetical protein GCM10028781_07000 [Nostocoides australiense]
MDHWARRRDARRGADDLQGHHLAPADERSVIAAIAKVNNPIPRIPAGERPDDGPKTGDEVVGREVGPGQTRQAGGVELVDQLTSRARSNSGVPRGVLENRGQARQVRKQQHTDLLQRAE